MLRTMLSASAPDSAWEPVMCTADESCVGGGATITAPGESLFGFGAVSTAPTVWGCDAGVVDEGGRVTIRPRESSPVLAFGSDTPGAEI
eukprot:CAMPEP_0115355484 /NCGR_PEP_ID=MMETSP0270-20121206/99126_1 /TAXON_ID=71861 /ORGANISM="Scrippsiella trochoidea, Strain CCMP3099" /LENGTH=88 /DNA_ID=CAMNT_0002777851 /DNA_START=163 /DNA_END=429 /DNA_ORIENTATION=+